MKKYTQDHEWVELDDAGKIGTIGISTYAAKALGDVVYVELPELNSEVSAGDTIGAVESVKSASDIMTPVSGTITEANGALEEKPGTVNKSPENEGWIARLEVRDQGELGALMDLKAYEEFTGEIEGKKEE
ncbi:MAG: glycine cleavage system H-protein subunit [Chrysothrix sp. TS-e1954]|nr:MAG: glycine cleavage system H-protein subunit [Chrysothrix sp. TS-e1954]